MSITVSGHEYRTLADKFYLDDGRQVMEAYANGVKVYPEDDFDGSKMFYVRRAGDSAFGIINNEYRQGLAALWFGNRTYGAVPVTARVEAVNMVDAVVDEYGLAYVGQHMVKWRPSTNEYQCYLAPVNDYAFPLRIDGGSVRVGYTAYPYTRLSGRRAYIGFSVRLDILSTTFLDMPVTSQYDGKDYSFLPSARERIRSVNGKVLRSASSVGSIEDWCFGDSSPVRGLPEGVEVYSQYTSYSTGTGSSIFGDSIYYSIKLPMEGDQFASFACRVPLTRITSFTEMESYPEGSGMDGLFGHPAPKSAYADLMIDVQEFD